MYRAPLLAALLLASAAFAQEPARPPSQAPLTFDLLYGDGPAPDFNGSVPRVPGWADGETYLLTDGGLRAVDAATGTSRPLMDRTAVAAALASQAGLDRATAEQVVGGRPTTTPDGNAAVFEAGGDLYLARLDGNRAVRLTATDAREELPAFSPDGSKLAFVRDFDLYAVDLATGAETRLTDGGTAAVRHGKADWVYFEELYDRSWKGYRWSPDSASLALMEYDDRGVGSFTVIDELPNPQRVELERYPKAGTANPDVRLGVVPADGSRPVRWFDLPVPEDGLIADFGWWPAARAGDPADLFAHVQDRTQTWLDLLRVDPATGSARTLLRDETAAWVSSPGPPHPLPDGSFLLASERDGWRHLYRFGPDGSLRGRVTAGAWEVRRVHEVTGATADGSLQEVWVYFTGTKDSHLAENLYRVRPDGTGLSRLTPEPGTHRPQVAPGGAYFVDTFDSVDVPPTVVLRRGDGTEVRTLGRATPDVDERYRLGSFEWVTIPARDGWAMDGYLIKPPGFDPARRYPVWVTTYGGPHAPHGEGRLVLLARPLGAPAGERRHRHAAAGHEGLQRPRGTQRVVGLPAVRRPRGAGPDRRGRLARRAAVVRRGPHRPERAQLRRVPHRLHADARRPLRRGHRGGTGHRLPQLRYDLYGAVHGHPAGERPPGTTRPAW